MHSQEYALPLARSALRCISLQITTVVTKYYTSNTLRLAVEGKKIPLKKLPNVQRGIPSQKSSLVWYNANRATMTPGQKLSVTITIAKTVNAGHVYIRNEFLPLRFIVWHLRTSQLKDKGIIKIGRKFMKPLRYHGLRQT